jgi:purine-nucleoside phosphorylase
MYDKIKQTSKFIQSKTNIKPKVGIVLGSGLGNLANQIEVETTIDYQNIPNFPEVTVKGHNGQMLIGKLGGQNIVAMQGRFHYYEGHSMKDLTFPIRVMIDLGIDLLIVSNAAGGMNSDFKVGDIMLINDHINLFPDNPLMGQNDDRLGARFPDMSQVYDKELIAKAHKIGLDNGISMKEGVYVGVSGPTFETPAEYRFFRTIGGDAVGMSTVPEAIVASHAQIKTFGFSIITDLGVEGEVVVATHEEVLEAANAAEPKLTLIVTELLKSL